MLIFLLGIVVVVKRKQKITVYAFKFKMSKLIFLVSCLKDVI